MKVPCSKGKSQFILARESCAGSREAVGEALTAARVGRVMSTENVIIWSAEAVTTAEGNTVRPAMARDGRAPRCLRPQGTHVRPPPGTGRSCATKAARRAPPSGQPCCTRDEGRSLGAAVQAEASNRPPLLRLTLVRRAPWKGAVS